MGSFDTPMGSYTWVTIQQLPKNSKLYKSGYTDVVLLRKEPLKQRYPSLKYYNPLLGDNLKVEIVKASK